MKTARRLDPAGLDRAVAVAREQVAAAEVPFAIVAVASGEQVALAEAIRGPAAAGVEPATICAIASITKPVVATAVMQLVAEGRVRLGDAIDRYVPELAAADRPTITLWHLLSHTSGLPDYDLGELLVSRPDRATLLQRIATAAGQQVTIEPWDYLFYAEKVRKERYDLDQNELKPYFELNNMIQAAFWTAGQLYGITFTEITGTVPVFHPDVRVWEVTEGDRHVGLFYGDYFARSGKRSGAWASTYRGHETFTGTERTPLSSNNNNFVKAGANEPTLISLDDAETLFHEFGHALHSLLSEVRYPGLSTTPRDYVELPSQVNEHWVLTRPVLDRFARHYQTKEPMPRALLDKVAASSKFNQGYITVEYLAAALVDMDMHTRAEPIADVAAFERESLARIGMPREIALRHRLPHFSHLFSSDSYSAGYYSYLWSEVMDADAWQAFEESGDVFDPTIARALREHILAPGNSSDRAEAYRRFRELIMSLEPRAPAPPP